MKHYLILILSVLMFISCGQQKQETNQPTLTVTIEPLRFFTEAIAGERYNVVSMVPAGSNPETYDPTPQQLVTLNKSCLLYTSPSPRDGLLSRMPSSA